MQTFRLKPTVAVNVVAAVVIAAECALAVFVVAKVPASQHMLLLSVFAATVLLLGWLLVLAPRLARITVGPVIGVRLHPYLRRDVPLASITKARLVNWHNEPEMKPAIRTGGAAVGRYLVGRFRLASRRPAAVLAAGERVVCLETAERLYLLAPDKFDEFVSALRGLGLKLG